MNESPGNAHEFTVSELSQAVKRTVEDEFGHVRVRGEVSKVSRPGSGHLYFDLKDETASLAAVAWRGSVSRLGFMPEQGLEVIATGRMTTFPGQSKYQLVVERIEPAGAGALMALLEERRRTFLAEGLFDADRKKPIPYLPRIIGVVTSPTGAVIRDILHRLEDRFPRRVLVWPVRVQGDSAAAEIAAAIAGFNAFTPDGPLPRPDLLIVARGGGSIEDLWSFNEEIVVRAVARSAIPVISAVGHETDTTLIDHVADLRAPTPTGAAEMAVPVRADLIAFIDALGLRQRQGLRRLADTRRDRLRAAAAHLPRPGDLLAIARQRLDTAEARLRAGLARNHQAGALRFARLAPRISASALSRRLAERRRDITQAASRTEPALRRRLERQALGLARLSGLMAAFDHRNVLARGFALVRRADGALVMRPGDVQPGDALAVQLAEGAIDANVSGAPPRPPRARPRPAPGDAQETLF